MSTEKSPQPRKPLSVKGFAREKRGQHPSFVERTRDRVQRNRP